MFDREKAAAESSDYGTGLDVIPGSERKLVFCTDEEEFGEPKLMKKLREKYYMDYAEHIRIHNERKPEEHNESGIYNETLPPRSVYSPENISFVKGLHYDLDNDGENEIVVMLGIDVWECVFYYIDGETIVDLTDLAGATDMSSDGDFGSSEHMRNDISVWTFGQYRFLTHTVGSYNVAFTTIYRCKDGGVFECIDYIAKDENWFNEAGYVLIRHHPNINVLPDYLVCTADGKLKELTSEELDIGTFREIYEKDGQMKAAFDKLGLDIDTVTKVQHIGFYDFWIESSVKFDRSSIARYSDGIAYEVFEGHEMSSDESLLHGINLYKLNVIGG